MADTPTPQPSVTNPLQANNTAAMAIAYAAGVLASKFPIFDSAAWQGILLAAGGVVFAIYTAYINRKSAIITTTANLPEVKAGGVILDKNVSTSAALEASTPSNVVSK